MLLRTSGVQELFYLSDQNRVAVAVAAAVVVAAVAVAVAVAAAVVVAAVVVAVAEVVAVAAAVAVAAVEGPRPKAKAAQPLFFPRLVTE